MRRTKKAAKARFGIEVDDYSEANDISIMTAVEELEESGRRDELVQEEMDKRFVPQQILPLEHLLKGIAISVLMRQLNDLKLIKHSKELDAQIDSFTDEELDELEDLDFGAYA